MSSVFQNYLDKVGEYGIVNQVNHPIVFIEGLPKAKTHEVLLFESGQQAEVFTISRGKIEARVFSHEPIRVGTKVARTNKLLAVPVGPELLGQTLSPLGIPLDTTSKYVRPKEERELDVTPGGISTRAKLTKPLITGIPLVDLMVPLGMGQRELIIGDRKTGKTSILLTTIKNQVAEGIIPIYCAIAKKKSDIKKVQQFFIEEKILDKVIIVATSSYDSPSLIYLTPYSGMSIAEYFRDQGKDVLLILDDLSTHAKFYRELSLLARRFPGRDSYPGDIFYIHSKLLERGGCYTHPKVGSVSITCLPVVEIVEGDLTGYVSTNIMGITDGHIYFDSNIYYQGRRPAINIPLSVTRVGRQTQEPLNRIVNKELTSFLSTFEKMQNLSHFGAELTDDVKKKLRTGDMIFNFFNQPYHVTLPSTVQLIIFSMIWQDIIIDKDLLEMARLKLTQAYISTTTQKLLFDIVNAKDLKGLNENVMQHRDQILALCK
jgi:F-type H+/Na+-transporting ATPase subunit alpha